MRSRVSLAMLSGLCVAGAALEVRAQEAGGQDGMKEITVTAQRREENIQNVPIAITALSADDLTSSQVRTTLDVARLIPNMVGGNNTGLGSANTYFIRGVGNGETIATFDPSVATYVDDIYVARQNDTNFSFFDVERMEVLRGPQGTLFGRNSSGGAINIVMKKPADHFGGFTEVSYGRFDEKLVRASVDLPVNSKLLTKFTGFYDQAGGYAHSLTTGETLNAMKNYGARFDLRYLPTDWITWDISADMIDADAPGVYNYGPADNRVALTGFSSQPGALRDLLTGEKGGWGQRINTRTREFRSDLSFDGNWGSLALISGYRTTSDEFAEDFYNGPFPTGGFVIANALDHHAFSQEVKFSSAKYERFDYVTGLYFFKEHNRTDIGNIFTVDTGTPAGLPLVLSDYTFSNDAEAQAAYGQINYHITDRFTATAGLRYTDEVKTIETRSNNNPLVPATAIFATADVAAAGNPTRLSTAVWTPRAVLDYKLTDHSNVYASATRGFKSGGWNARSSTPQTFTAFLPEKVWAYELGIRSTFPEQRLRLNATAFYQIVQNFQLPAGYETATGEVFLTSNFSDLQDYGLESEATWEPIDNLTLSSSLGLQQAKYVNIKDNILEQQKACLSGTTSECGTGIVAPNGMIARPQYTPKFTFINKVVYSLDVGGFKVTPNVALQIEGERAVSTANIEGSIQPTTFLVDAGVELAPANGPWTVSASCRNCTDRTVKEGTVPPYVFLNRPGVWTLDARWNF